MLKKLFLFSIPLFYVLFVYQRLLTDHSATILGETERYDTYPIVETFEILTKHKTFPLWDNRVGSGMSAIGHPLYQQTNPLIYVLAPLFTSNPLYAMRIYFLIYLLMAAYSFLFLTIYLKINRIAGVMATIAYIGSYQVLIFTMMNGFRPDLILMAFLPIIFLLLFVALDKKSVLSAIFAGAAFALAIHSGMAFYAPIVLIIFMIFGLIYGIVKRDLLSVSKMLITFLICLFGFSAVKAIPIAEFLQNSSRKAFTIKEAEEGVDAKYYIDYVKRYILLGFLPTSYGNVKPIAIDRYLAIGFFISVAAALFHKNKLLVFSIATTCVIGLIIAGGNTFPVDLYALIYEYVPGFKSIRFPVRFLMPLYLLIPILFALGANILQKINKLFGVAFIVIIVVLSTQARRIVDDYTYSKYTVSWYDELLKKIKDDETKPYRMAARFSLLPYDRQVIPVYQITAVNKDNFDSVMNLYDDARPMYYKFHPIPDFAAEPDQLDVWHEKFSLLNVKYLLTSSRPFPKHKYYKDVTDTVSKKYNMKADGQVIEVLNTRDRFFFTPSADFKIKGYQEIPGKLEISFSVNKPGSFIYSNTYYPGWEAKLDGVKTPIHLADGVVKGVSIATSGEHNLIMEYKPKSFYIGLGITLFSILSTSALVWRKLFY